MKILPKDTVITRSKTTGLRLNSFKVKKMLYNQSTISNFKWIELAAFVKGAGTVQRRFARIDDAFTGLRDQFNNTDIFASICRYQYPHPQSRYIAPIYFDIDCKNNLESARQNALILCELLNLRLQLDTEQINIHFNGNSGFHISVDCEVFYPEPSNLALTLNRKMAQNAKEQGVRFIDLSVYGNNRLWRLPNSINGENGLYKIPLHHKELMHLSIGRIIELAKNGREQESFSSKSLNPNTRQWHKSALQQMERIVNSSIGCNKPKGLFDTLEYKQKTKIIKRS